MGSTTGTSTEHRYQTCRDESCERFICRAYAEGRRDGEQDGRRRGFDEAYPVAYDRGFQDGLRACPLPHK